MRKPYLIGAVGRCCMAAALTTGLGACNSQKPTNESGQAANEARQTSNQALQPKTEKQAAAKVAGVKCPDSYAPLPADATDLTRNVYACVERTALLFAKGPDSAEALSKAVVVKCKDPITRYVDQEAKKAGVKAQYKEPTQSWQDHALLIISEARARRCS